MSEVDVYCLKKSNTGTKTLEVHTLGGANNYQTFIDHTGTLLGEADAAQNYVFALADYNRDGVLDLYCLKKTNAGTNTFEVHVLDGSGDFQNYLLHTGTAIAEADAAANFDFAVADYNHDGHPDIYCLKKTNTGTNTFEVHVLNGADNFQTFLLQTGTALAQADAAANFDFAVADYNGDGHSDVYCLKKTDTATNTFEVHVLSGAANFQTFLLHTGTALGQADAEANFDFAVADYNGDGHPDVYCLKKTDTATNTFEVHILSGSGNFKTFLLHTGTALAQADAAANFDFAVAKINIHAGGGESEGEGEEEGAVDNGSPRTRP